ncbi:GNAT family N-acetyltransferase [Vibrio astriarenae]|uniref:GNAT family N-acetyltransferase n=1 Tax=Vibrio astriarenae TaxID=1481923 RepID=UPI001EF7BA3B|nr:GNAT family N-acetyltransferase [Vibrio astriarenae]
MEIEGAVVGYAYASTWKARSAYRYTVESSVYISHDYLRNGLGSTLYGSLLERLKQEQYCNVIGSIALPNDPSVRVHERLGFTKVGEFSDIGLKFGEKRSVGYWQLRLNE